MNTVTGDIWCVANPNDFVVIPTNGIVKANGELVMGAGLAKQARDRVPGCASYFGTLVRNSGNHVYRMHRAGKPKLVSFPTKNHYRDPSTIQLISRSAVELNELAHTLPTGRFLLPMVGTGYGGLKWVKVKQTIDLIIDAPNIIIIEDER